MSLWSSSRLPNHDKDGLYRERTTPFPEWRRTEN